MNDSQKLRAAADVASDCLRQLIRGVPGQASFADDASVTLRNIMKKMDVTGLDENLLKSLAAARKALSTVSSNGDADLPGIADSLESTIHSYDLSCAVSLPHPTRPAPPMPNIKPPIGLRPRSVWLRERQAEILEAMNRYAAEGKACPVGWIDELSKVSDEIYYPKEPTL